ncbi:MAG: BolA/IbaG family iron-sulfur metabolism protein [Rickettsiales bacterium]
MPISENKLQELLMKSFPDARLEIRDLVGDEDHYEVIIESRLFNKKNRLEQHKLVNQALHGCLGGELHALTIKTKAINKE